jgi:hypothetical protein
MSTRVLAIVRMDFDSFGHILGTPPGYHCFSVSFISGLRERLDIRAIFCQYFRMVRADKKPEESERGIRLAFFLNAGFTDCGIAGAS